MKEEQKVYIRGSKNRPNDVRKVLEQHGGKVEEGIKINFILEDSFYYINHDGIIDYTSEESELYKMITEYYHEVKLPNSENWKTGDILVNYNSSKFYVFDKFTEQGNIFVYLEIIKDSREDKILSITEMYHLISCTSLHKVNNKELKIFHDILAEKNLSWDTYNKELIQGNYTYFYPKNGHYYFRRNTLRCKDKTTGEWYDAVLYSDANGQYVREVNDFNKKFKKI